MKVPSLNKFTEMIHSQLELAEKKHPVFCDKFTNYNRYHARIDERCCKELNKKGPFRADIILLEEVAEARTAFVDKDFDHCLEELSQCGAVVLRMMEYVQTQKEKEVAMPCGGKKTGGKKPPKK